MAVFKVFLVALALIHLIILIEFGFYMSLRDLIEVLKEDKRKEQK